MQIKLTNEVTCFRCSIQMDYILPEVLDGGTTTLLCPNCEIKYFIPNKLLQEGKVLLKANYIHDYGDTGSGLPASRNASAMPHVTPTHSDA